MIKGQIKKYQIRSKSKNIEKHGKSTIIRIRNTSTNNRKLDKSKYIGYRANPQIFEYRANPQIFEYKANPQINKYKANPQIYKLKEVTINRICLKNISNLAKSVGSIIANFDFCQFVVIHIYDISILITMTNINGKNIK